MTLVLQSKDIKKLNKKIISEQIRSSVLMVSQYQKKLIIFYLMFYKSRLKSVWDGDNYKVILSYKLNKVNLLETNLYLVEVYKSHKLISKSSVNLILSDISNKKNLRDLKYKKLAF